MDDNKKLNTPYGWAFLFFIPSKELVKMQLLSLASPLPGKQSILINCQETESRYRFNQPRKLLVPQLVKAGNHRAVDRSSIQSPKSTVRLNPPTENQIWKGGLLHPAVLYLKIPA